MRRCSELSGHRWKRRLGAFRKCQRAVVPTDADADGGLRLARRRLASGCPGFACVVRTHTARRSAFVDTTAEVLNDVFVRSFCMTERRIAERTGRGVVCFISNCSWPRNVRPTRASSRPRATRRAFRSARRSRRSCGERSMRRRGRSAAGISGARRSARSCLRRPRAEGTRFYDGVVAQLGPAGLRQIVGSLHSHPMPGVAPAESLQRQRQRRGNAASPVEDPRQSTARDSQSGSGARHCPALSLYGLPENLAWVRGVVHCRHGGSLGRSRSG